MTSLALTSVFAESFVRVIILTLLVVSVITLVVTLISIAVSKMKSDSLETTHQHSLIYLAVFGAIFIFVLISLGLLVLNQLKAVESDGAVATESFISLITICISFATLVPFFVTKALTNSELERKVQSVVDDNVKRVRQAIDKESRYAVSRLNTSDADISRMIGYLLMTNERPDYFWSMSWIARAVKARMIAAEENYQKTGRHEVSELFMSHCVRFIVYDIVNIYRSSCAAGGIGKYIDSYMAETERAYTGSDNPELTRQCTVARLLRDYVALQDDISPRRIFNIDESRLGSPIKVVDIIAAIDWVCVEISNYLESHSITIDDVAFRVLTFEENKVYSGVNEKLKVMKERYSKSNMETVMMRLSQQISGCDFLCIPDQEK